MSANAIEIFVESYVKSRASESNDLVRQQHKVAMRMASEEILRALGAAFVHYDAFVRCVGDAHSHTDPFLNNIIALAKSESAQSTHPKRDDGRCSSAYQDECRRAPPPPLSEMREIAHESRKEVMYDAIAEQINTAFNELLGENQWHFPRQPFERLEALIALSRVRNPTGNISTNDKTVRLLHHFVSRAETHFLTCLCHGCASLSATVASVALNLVGSSDSDSQHVQASS